MFAAITFGQQKICDIHSCLTTKSLLHFIFVERKGDNKKDYLAEKIVAVRLNKKTN